MCWVLNLNLRISILVVNLVFTGLQPERFSVNLYFSPTLGSREVQEDGTSSGGSHTDHGAEGATRYCAGCGI